MAASSSSGLSDSGSEYRPDPDDGSSKHSSPEPEAILNDVNDLTVAPAKPQPKKRGRPRRRSLDGTEKMPSQYTAYTSMLDRLASRELDALPGRLGGTRQWASSPLLEWATGPSAEAPGGTFPRKRIKRTTKATQAHARSSPGPQPGPSRGAEGALMAFNRAEDEADEAEQELEAYRPAAAYAWPLHPSELGTATPLDKALSAAGARLADQHSLALPYGGHFEGWNYPRKRKRAGEDVEASIVVESSASGSVAPEASAAGSTPPRPIPARKAEATEGAPELPPAIADLVSSQIISQLNVVFAGLSALRPVTTVLQRDTLKPIGWRGVLAAAGLKLPKEVVERARSRMEAMFPPQEPEGKPSMPGIIDEKDDEDAKKHDGDEDEASRGTTATELLSRQSTAPSAPPSRISQLTLLDPRDEDLYTIPKLRFSHLPRRRHLSAKEEAERDEARERRLEKVAARLQKQKEAEQRKALRHAAHREKENRRLKKYMDARTNKGKTALAATEG